MKLSFSILILSNSALISAAPGDGAWASAYVKAATALAKLSNNDKINLVTGVGWQKGPCVGNTPAISSIGYPSLCLQDGPLGVRYAQGVTALPAGVMAASTWDEALIYGRGYALGEQIPSRLSFGDERSCEIWC